MSAAVFAARLELGSCSFAEAGRAGRHPFTVAIFYTIGHSTRSWQEFVEVLHAHSIQSLVDIRSFPVSKRLPHFNREALQKTLPRDNIAYLWMKELGGRRPKIRDDSPNVGLRSISFRNYADYMLTRQFESAIAALIHVAGHSRTAYMCAERVYFKCHRMLVSDWLVMHGHEVLHVEGSRAPKLHKPLAQMSMIYGPELRER
jgi:uncharacterized protein (DUF488 family)